MNISGRNVIAATRDQVWDAINDPAVLARTLPGCESLEVIGDDHYRATVTAGVASIRGTYTGTVKLSDPVAPSSLQLAAQGAGSAGTIGADVDVNLSEDGDVTAVDWDATAVVGGMIGGVGQRMLTGVATRMAGEFFDNLEADIVGAGQPAADADDRQPAGAATTGADAPGKVDGRAAATGTVFAGRVSRDGAEGRIEFDDPVKLVGAFALGAVVALVGVLIGRRTR